MKVLALRLSSLALIAAGAAIAFANTACSTTLSQPFQGLKGAPVTIHRLQNFEPPQQQAGAASPIPGVQIPPQIQQWLSGAAAALPPGLIPPGLLPGTQFPTATDAPRFYNFRILGTMAVTDTKMRDEILEIFGKESNFQPPRQSCMYADFGFQIGQSAPPGQPTAMPTGGGADILVSLSCELVEMKNQPWPYGGNTGLKPDTQKKLMEIIRRAFGTG